MDRPVRAQGTSEAVLWLALLSSATLKRQTAKRLLYRWCIEEGRSAAALLGARGEELAQHYGLSAAEAAQVSAARAHIKAQEARLAQWRKQGIGLLTRADVAYPEGWLERILEERLPYLVFYRGDLALLAQPGIAILGGANPGAQAQAAAQAVARWLATTEYILVSGHHPGIERAALEAARSAGGSAALILPAGLEHYPDLASVAGAQELVLSPYLPETPPSEALAQARWPLVMALAEALVLVAPDLAPGAWPAVDAFLAGGRPVLLWTGMDEGQTSAWREAGALLCATPEAVEQALAEALLANGAWPAQTGTKEGTASAPDETLGETIPLDDAEAAIAALSKTGRVPEALARRLRQLQAKGDR